MDEFRTPVLVEVAPSENLNTLLAERASPPCPTTTLIERKTTADGPWMPITAREFDAEVVAVAKGLVARGHRAGRPRRHHEPHPLRVDPPRLRHLGRRRRPGPALRDVVGRAGPVDPLRLRRAAARRGDRRSTPRRSRRSAAAPRASATSSSSTTARSTTLSRGRRRRSPDEEIARRRALRRARRRRHDHLHLGDDRPAQGRRADPRQLRRPDPQRRRRASASSARRGRAPCSSCPWRTSSRGSSRCSSSRPAPSSATPRTPRTCSRTSAPFRPTFILSVPRVFEKVYNSSEQKAAAGGKRAIFQRAAKTAIVYSRALDHPRGPEPVAAPPAQGRRRPGAAQDPRRARRAGAVGDLRRRPARRAARALLPRRRPARPRGLRPDRDDGAGHRQPARTRTKIGTVGPPLPGTAIADRRRTARSSSRAPRVFRGYHNNPEATAEAFDRTAGSAPATSARWTRTATCGSPAARRRSSSPPAARTSRPPSSRTACVATRWSARWSSSATRKPFIGALITLDAEALPGLARHARPAGDGRRDRGRRPAGARARSTARSSGPTRPSRGPSRSASTRSSPPTSRSPTTT